MLALPIGAAHRPVLDPFRKSHRVAARLRRSGTRRVGTHLDTDYTRRATEFIQANAAAQKPFLLYFNHTLMHIPVVPRDEYRGLSGNGDWADCLLQLDGDFGALLDALDDAGVAENTIVVFAGDNGNEDTLLHRGTGGFWEGSYFTGMEAALRTPCLVRWLGHIPGHRTSNEIMHVTDWFDTLLTMAGLPVPDDRVIDGEDQTPFLTGDQETSNRDGFIYWNGERMYGVKWQNFKLAMVQQKYFADPALPLGFPHVINLIVDPKEREPYEPRYFHSWTMAHFTRILNEFEEVPAASPSSLQAHRSTTRPPARTPATDGVMAIGPGKGGGRVMRAAASGP
jgi:arylsulfatase A-like enzyme